MPETYRPPAVSPLKKHRDEGVDRRHPQSIGVKSIPSLSVQVLID
jgi:hypothetical protein